MTTLPPLHSVWPEVALRFELQLRRRGFDRAAALGLVQDVTARVLSARPCFESAEDLLHWLTVLERHLAVDGHRSAKRFVCAVDEGVSRVDGESEVLGRLAVDALWQALTSSTAVEHRALARQADVLADRAEQVRMAVRRHRARTLALMLDAAEDASA